MEPVFRQTAIQAGVVTFPGSDVLPGSCPQTVKMCVVMSLCCHSFFRGSPNASFFFPFSAPRL